MKRLPRLSGKRSIRRGLIVTVVAAAASLALALSASATNPAQHVTSSSELAPDQICAVGQNSGGGSVTYSWFDYHSANEADITVWDNGVPRTYAAVVAGKFPSTGSFPLRFSLTNGDDYSFTAVLFDRKGNPIIASEIPLTSIGTANCT